MSTTRAQQVGIWIIAVTMTIGTIASFVAIVLSNQNQQTQTARQQEETERQLKEYEEAQKKYLAALEPMEGYSAEPFDASTATELKTEVLSEGTGDVVKESDTIKAHYFGWLKDGKIFDSTNKKDAGDEAISFSLQQVIEGWTKGLAGQKAGSVVKLTIPAAQGYGSQANGAIPANSPLQFIVKIESIEAAAKS